MSFKVHKTGLGKVIVTMYGGLTYETVSMVTGMDESKNVKEWHLNLSTSVGCSMSCRFCDCHKSQFGGQVMLDGFEEQLRNAYESEAGNISEADRLIVSFARCGEPSYNPYILQFLKYPLNSIVNKMGHVIEVGSVYPVLFTMLPKNNPKLVSFLQGWTDVLRDFYKGHGKTVFSINTTDEMQRNVYFQHQCMSLDEVADLVKRIPELGDVNVLNFAVNEDTDIDSEKLGKVFDKGRYAIHLTQTYLTRFAKSFNREPVKDFESYVYDKFVGPLVKDGWDVSTKVISDDFLDDACLNGNCIME